MKHPLLIILEEKARKWERDNAINPIHANIEIQSVWVESGRLPHVSFDVRMNYSYLIRMLLLPLYIVSAISSFSELFDYLEDVAYFKAITRKGINRKYGEIAKIRSRVNELIDEELSKFEQDNG